MSGAGRALLASALAPLAVLAVLVAGVSAAVVYPGDDPAAGPDGDPGPSTSSSTSAPADPDATPTAPDGRLLVSDEGRSDAVFTVPDTDDWSLAEGSDISYTGADGEIAVGVSDPALFREGFCDASDGLVYRAFVGFSAPVPADRATVQGAAEDALGRWSAALDEEGAAGDDPTVTPVRLDDGSAGWTGAQVLPVGDPESECDPRAREVRVVSVASTDEVSTVVLLRDVDAQGDDLRDGLSADAADEVLRTLAPG